MVGEDDNGSIPSGRDVVMWFGGQLLERGDRRLPDLVVSFERPESDVDRRRWGIDEWQHRCGHGGSSWRREHGHSHSFGWPITDLDGPLAAL